MDAAVVTQAEEGRAVALQQKTADAAGGALPIERLRRALDDLFAPNPVRYWLDFGLSTILFGVAFILVATRPLGDPVTLLVAAVSVLALYRAVIFIHELVHLPPGQMRGFRLAWHLCCGFPLLSPTFLYATHADHHRRQTYGTAADGEYLPWGRPGGRLSSVGFLASSFLAMPAGALRFALLGPLSWVSPALRRWVIAHASSLVVDPRYRRPPPSPGEERRWRWQEAAVFVYLTALAAGLATGSVAVAWLEQLYLTLSAALMLNGLRTLAAHRYRSAGTPMTATEQLLDSVNYPRRGGGLFATVRGLGVELWAPVGLRYHALHHLFPGIPYHNLAPAHARIAALLPPGSPYHRAEGTGLVASLRALWYGAGAAPPFAGHPAAPSGSDAEPAG